MDGNKSKQGDYSGSEITAIEALIFIENTDNILMEKPIHHLKYLLQT
jgi:hypothetical protein